MLRYFFIGFALLVLLIVSMTGLRGWKSKRPPIEIFPDMVHQPKYKAQTESTFFADGRSARDHATGTVPLGYQIPSQKEDISSQASPSQTPSGLTTQDFATRNPNTDGGGPYQNIQFSASPDYVSTGRMGKNWGTGIPFHVTSEILARGKERFTINCAVCHGDTGKGNGITSKYGLNGIASLHQQRIREMADGEIFNTITWGKNSMMGYGSNIQVPDRWAIICYIRALQRSQHTIASELPPELRQQLPVKQPSSDTAASPATSN